MSFPWIEPLHPWNPLDHLRLLWWVLATPQRLKAYRGTFGEKAERRVGKWLVSALTWLPLFIPTLAIGIGTLPRMERAFPSVIYLWISHGLVLAWFLTSWFGDRDNPRASGVALGMAIILTLGVTIFVPGGLAVGVTGVVALGVAVLITLGVAVGVAVFVTGAFEVGATGDTRADVASVVTLGVVGSVVLATVFGVVMIMTENMTKPVMYEELLIVASVVVGILIGLVFAVVSSVRKGLETGHPSWAARGSLAMLLLAYAFLIWFSLQGGWQIFR